MPTIKVILKCGSAHKILWVRIVKRVICQADKIIYHCMIVSVATSRLVSQKREGRNGLTYNMDDVMNDSGGEEQREEQILPG